MDSRFRQNSNKDFSFISLKKFSKVFALGKIEGTRQDPALNINISDFEWKVSSTKVPFEGLFKLDETVIQSCHNDARMQKEQKTEENFILPTTRYNIEYSCKAPDLEKNFNTSIQDSSNSTGMSDAAYDSNQLLEEVRSSTEELTIHDTSLLSNLSSSTVKAPSLNLVDDDAFEPLQLPSSESDSLKSLKIGLSSAEISSKASSLRSTNPGGFKGTKLASSNISNTSFCSSNEELKNLITSKRNNLRKTNFALK